MWGTQSEQLQQELPHVEKEICIQIQRLDEKAQIPTKEQSLQRNTTATALKIYVSQPTAEF